MAYIVAMTKIYVIPILLFLSIASIHPILAQTSDSGLTQWEALISRQIKYPIEAIRARKEGVVAISLSTDEEGNLGEIKLQKTASQYFDNQSLEAVQNVRDLWSAEMLADRKPGETYLLVFNYFFLQEGSSKQDKIKSAMDLIQKGKPEKALKIAEQMVNGNPFDAKGLQLRSQIHRQLGQEEAATADLLAYQEMTKKVITQIDVKVFQQVSTRSVSGTIRN